MVGIFHQNCQNWNKAMTWWLLATALASAMAEPFGYPGPNPFGYPLYRGYQQPQPLVVTAPGPPPPPPLPPPVIVDLIEQLPANPGPPPPPVGFKCNTCTGPDCSCELCVERTCAAPEPLSLLELALNPFFYVQYVEDCPQAIFLDNVCFLFVPLLDLSSLFTFGQIITFQDGTVEQRQYEIDCIKEGSQFTAIGSGCKFRFEIIYADILCGVYVIQRCFENACCAIDSGPVQIVSTLLPPASQCLVDALDYVQKLYPCKKYVQLPQENASLCTVLGNTLVPSQG